MVDGKLIKAADVKERKWRIRRAGQCAPLRNWSTTDGTPLGRSSTFDSRITQWGERGFEHAVSADSGNNFGIRDRSSRKA